MYTKKERIMVVHLILQNDKLIITSAELSPHMGPSCL